MPAAAQAEVWSAETAKQDVTLFLAALSFLVGIVHLEAAIFHGTDAWSHAAFFAVIALFQLAWPVWLYRDPSRKTLVVGGAVSAAVVCVWVMSRTVGAPGGPTPWQPEAVRISDLAATLGELVIVLLVVSVLCNRAWPVLRGPAQFAIAMVLALAGTAIAFGGHGHW